jgi:asparagine synthase (glutamine-hydrolysing)
MCGIWSLVNLLNNTFDVSKLFTDFWNLKHRGPDNSHFEIYNQVHIGFHRLSIMDTSFKSNQPFIFQENNKTIIFICNGEIYNYKELIQKQELSIKNNSDCMTIPQLYIKYTRANNLAGFYDLFKTEIKGEFAFILYEFDNFKNLTNLIVARDQVGIRPLYYHPFTNKSKFLLFSSEIKGTNSFSEEIHEFPPGFLFHYQFDNFGKIYQYDICFRDIYNIVSNKNLDIIVLLNNIKYNVISVVKRRLLSDRPLAFLLSGGVDSSLVAAIASKILGVRINTFCCGMNEGTDLIYAKKVANLISSNHREVYFTAEEALKYINDVIWTTETWDTTTIRASIGQYIVSKYISQNTDSKVLLVGEGSDEVCSSYLFNWYSPSPNALHNTAIEYVNKIHYFDVKRADRCISRWGLEARVPLLDPEFIKSYWNIPSEYRPPQFKGIEKWFLRRAFEDSGILPAEVLWRKKEAFSDGISGKFKSWFQILQEYIDPLVPDFELENAHIKYPYNTPKTKEAYYYREVFCKMFGHHRQTVIPHYWQPKWNSDGSLVTDYVDPSARTLGVYADNSSL